MSSRRKRRRQKPNDSDVIHPHRNHNKPPKKKQKLGIPSKQKHPNSLANLRNYKSPQIQNIDGEHESDARISIQRK